MKVIITPVGTSLFTNYMRKEIQTAFELAGKTYHSIEEEFEKLRFIDSAVLGLPKWERIVSRVNDVIKSFWFAGITKMDWKTWECQQGVENVLASAEIKSILKIKERFAKEGLRVQLIATDTILSCLAARLIKQWFDMYGNKNGIDVFFNEKTDVAKGLQVINGATFEKEGIPSLMKICNKIVDEFHVSNLIMNVTGGYKAMLPYFTIYAQVHDIPIFYIFEETDQLIHIPQVPLSIDWNIFDKYWDQFSVLEKEGAYDSAKLPRDFLSAAAGCLDWEENLVGFNALGFILWNRYKSKYFIFYAPDDVWEEIQQQEDIKRILKTKFYRTTLRKSKTEIKGEHTVYDDGDNNNRIYYFERQDQVFIYKTFQSEEKAKAYINSLVDREAVIKSSKPRKVEVENV